MPSRHLSVRLDDSTYRRLEAEGRRSGRSKSEVAKTLLEEGLRMQLHQGVTFRAGPAGRRPGLIGGPDVWEVIRVLLGVEAKGEAAIEQTTELTGLPPDQVRTALRYYAEHGEEIEQWIARVDAEADEAEAAWLRGQELLQR